jgi:hypothetical protein
MFSRLAFYSLRQAYIHIQRGKKKAIQPAEKPVLKRKKKNNKNEHTQEKRRKKMCEGGKNKNSNKNTI